MYFLSEGWGLNIRDIAHFIKPYRDPGFMKQTVSAEGYILEIKIYWILAIHICVQNI